MDPIADMITRIRNASAVRLQTVAIPLSALTLAIAEILLREKWIQDISQSGKKTRRSFEITLRYSTDGGVINEIRRISKSSKRIYRGWEQLHSVRQGYGMAIISTPKGLLTDLEARKQRVGGEVLLEVW